MQANGHNRGNYYLNFILKSIPRPFEYVVNVDDWKRVSELFRQDQLPDQFIIFQELERKRRVYVNSHFVLFHQALFDTGLREETTDLSKESIRPVEFYLDGVTLTPPPEDELVDKTRCIQAASNINPSRGLQFDLDDMLIDDLNQHLALYKKTTEAFITFTDGDGEQNSIRAATIMLVETPNIENENES
jgi:hypothetical protein